MGVREGGRGEGGVEEGKGAQRETGVEVGWLEVPPVSVYVAYLLVHCRAILSCSALLVRYWVAMLPTRGSAEIRRREMNKKKKVRRFYTQESQRTVFRETSGRAEKAERSEIAFIENKRANIQFWWRVWQDLKDVFETNNMRTPFVSKGLFILDLWSKPLTVRSTKMKMNLTNL